jgi:hypothetical protein
MENEKVNYAAMPRLKKMKVILSNLERLAVLEGIDDTDLRRGIELVRHAIQSKERGK